MELRSLVMNGSAIAYGEGKRRSRLISADRFNSFYNQNPDLDILKFNLLNGQTDKLN